MMGGVAYALPIGKTFYTTIGNRIHECRALSHDIINDKVAWQVAGRGVREGTHDTIGNQKVYYSLTAARMQNERGVVDDMCMIAIDVPLAISDAYGDYDERILPENNSLAVFPYYKSIIDGKIRQSKVAVPITELNVTENGIHLAISGVDMGYYHLTKECKQEVPLVRFVTSEDKKMCQSMAIEDIVDLINGFGK